ncbi:hypothetical protein [Microcoleus sp. B3-D7]|uniref:hypothetical protein n=1 Tax=Microcoleus sp. B3-D7 TaxID=2818659 RepID=UPI002FD02533
MAIFSGETSGYNKALELVKALELSGIDAFIGAGAVAINCKPDQVNLARQICTELSAVFREGYIGSAQNFLLKSKDGTDLARRAKDDAHSVAKEWE